MKCARCTEEDLAPRRRDMVGPFAGRDGQYRPVSHRECLNGPRFHLHVGVPGGSRGEIRACDCR
jgi:hypothetical protein